MKKRASLVALRIAAIKAEFTEMEIHEAVKLLEDHGSRSELLAYFAGLRPTSSTNRNRGSKATSIENQRSKAVVELEHQDPDKFQVLSEFDSLIRRSQVFPDLDDIKRLGEKLSKEFEPRNSRRELISKLMALLADRPLDEIREIVKVSLSTSQVDKKDNDYQRLAQFIITGEAPRAESEQRR
jgi:hypothetical protein